MTSPLDSLVSRGARPSDWDRIRSDWKRSYRDSMFGRLLTTCGSSALYENLMSQVVERALVHCDITCLVWQENDDAIAAWAATEGTSIVHYVYTKKDYRRLGLARRLVGHVVDATYTHSSVRLRDIRLPGGWTFDPRPALREAT